MNKKEVMEIKRRFKKESATFSRMCGCYVNSEKEKLLTFGETFLNIEEEEMFKYMDIASKVLSGRIGDQLMELTFESLGGEDDGMSGMQTALLEIRDSRLLDDELLDSFYDNVIASYNCVGNYLILLYHDVYDIPMKTTDNMLLDDSDEVYDYILCAICPVNLSKSGLGYDQKENRIAPLMRDWVVGAPDSGFIYPAFTERSADLHSILMYTRNVKDPDRGFWEEGIHAVGRLTSTEKRMAFNNMLEKTIGGEPEEIKETILDVEEELSAFIAEKQEKIADDEEVFLEPEDVKIILTDSGIPEHKANRVAESYESFFPEEVPMAKEILDEKALKNSELRSEKKELARQVVKLTDQLRNAGLITEDGEEVPIAIKVDDDRADQITAAIVDGRRCIVIPLDGENEATINGEVVEF